MNQNKETKNNPLSTRQNSAGPAQVNRKLKTLWIWLAVLIGSFWLFLKFMPLAFSGIAAPFLIFLIVYGIASVGATMKFSTLGKFFNWSLPLGSGNRGCLLVPFHMFVYPAMGLISLVAGPIVLLIEISKVLTEKKQIQKS